MKETKKITSRLNKFFLIAYRFLVVSSFCLFTLVQSYAYEVETHVEITNRASIQANKFARFINEFNLQTPNAVESIEDGSEREDDGFINISIFSQLTCRCAYHFYDPTTGQGLNKGPLNFESSLGWGFDSGSARLQNNYSWTKAREDLYIALTGKNFAGQDVIQIPGFPVLDNFQPMFRSLGQVMHLVEDLASPACEVHRTPKLPPAAT